MLLDAFKKEQTVVRPYMNTGTLYDVASGAFRPSIDGHMFLDGGLSSYMGIAGRGQTYKSSIAGSLLAKALTIHPAAEGYIYETEGNVSGVQRYDELAGTTISDRLVFKTSVDLNLTQFYDEFSKICEEKEKHKKDYLVESPFADVVTGKPLKVWIPTFLLIDSFSRARSEKGDTQFDNNDVSDSGMNTMWMSEGNIKSRINSDLPTRAARCGIYAISVAHMGDNMSMDQFSPPSKQMQFMKQTDKLKNVGSNFTLLTTALIQTLKAQLLQDSNKNCLYPTPGDSNPRELSQVDVGIIRNKNNMSGAIIPFISSQSQGLIEELTDLTFLRNNKNYGLSVKGNNQGFSPVLTPEISFSRNNVRTKCKEDYELKRALEILAQLCFIQSLWSTSKLPSYFMTKPEEIAEFLYKNNNTAQRILNSTGSWSTSKQDREVLSVYDILNILFNPNCALNKKSK